MGPLLVLPRPGLGLLPEQSLLLGGSEGCAACSVNRPSGTWARPRKRGRMGVWLREHRTSWCCWEGHSCFFGFGGLYKSLPLGILEPLRNNDLCLPSCSRYLQCALGLSRDRVCSRCLHRKPRSLFLNPVLQAVVCTRFSLTPDPGTHHSPFFPFPVQMSVSFGNIIHEYHWNLWK